MLTFDDLVESLTASQEMSGLKYLIQINNVEYPFKDVLVKKSPTPVNAPTTRGGVYFSEKFAYKVQGTINDLSVLPFLSKNMLGPNTEFVEIKITTQIVMDGTPKTLHLFANLINIVQKPTQIELNMILVRIE